MNRIQGCTCQKMGRTPALCVGQYGFEENGIRVSCKPKRNEQVFAIQLDGCLLNDNDPKCDGAFIWQAPNRAALLLVELKGAGDIPHAFGQLAYVKNRRPEYQQLKSLITTPRPIEKAFIVSSGVISKPQKEKLENTHRIRVEAVVQTQANKTIPDLREYL